MLARRAVLWHWQGASATSTGVSMIDDGGFAPTTRVLAVIDTYAARQRELLELRRENMREYAVELSILERARLAELHDPEPKESEA